jgi:hypothetical protein
MRDWVATGRKVFYTEAVEGVARSAGKKREEGFATESQSPEGMEDRNPGERAGEVGEIARRKRSSRKRNSVLGCPFS